MYLESHWQIPDKIGVLHKDNFNCILEQSRLMPFSILVREKTKVQPSFTPNDKSIKILFLKFN